MKVARPLLMAGLVSIACASVPASASPDGFTSPWEGDRLVAGTAVDVVWTPSAVPPQAEEMELVLSLDGGRTFPVRVTRELEAGAAGVTWRVPNFVSGEVRLALRAGLDGQERIVFLSPEFTIVADPTAQLELPVAREGELWTREALDGRPVCPFPPDSLGDARERISAGIPADPSLDDPFPRVLVVSKGQASVLTASLLTGSFPIDGPSRPAVRPSLPKRE